MDYWDTCTVHLFKSLGSSIFFFTTAQLVPAFVGLLSYSDIQNGAREHLTTAMLGMAERQMDGASKTRDVRAYHVK